MRLSFLKRAWPYGWRVILFIVIFAAVGEVFIHFHARGVKQTQQYVESGSPLVIVVDDPVVLDMVNHIVQGHARVVRVDSIARVDESAVQNQTGPELNHARYIFFAVDKKKSALSGSVVYLDDLISTADLPARTPWYVSTTESLASDSFASSSSIASSTILVYGTTTASEISTLGERYFWVSPNNAEGMVGGIARALGTNDAINKTFFINNAYEYSSQIGLLRTSGYIERRMKDVPAVMVDGRYIDFAVDFGFDLRGVIDGASFETAQKQESFDTIARAIKATKAKVLFVPDTFPMTDFHTYARTHRLTIPIVALSSYPEQADEGYLDILQYNVLRLQNAVL
ncbi:MAG: zinc ABC transporter substrate-binding protein [Candidatus Paceibacterota bacterium]|jgi:ABC-type Zn uptake system ZnuABC Zn-binding protein ZnuA